MNKAVDWIWVILFIVRLGNPAVSDQISIGQVREAAETLQMLEQQFARRTAEARLSFLCLGRFAETGQAEALEQLAAETAEKARPLVDRQQALQKRMEDYPGRDWEELYGQTHLWSTCRRTVLQGTYLLARCRFWQALGADEERTELLGQVLETCRSPQARWGGQENILEVLALWQRGGPGDEERLRVVLHQMMLRSDLTEAARDRMLLLQRRFGLFDKGPFLEELEALFQTKQKAGKDFEWALEYAFVEWAYAQERPIEQVLETWPEAKGFVSSLLLEACADQMDRQGREVASKWDSFVVSAVCEAVAGSEHPERYRGLIETLAQGHERPEVFLAMAEVESGSRPEQAMDFYLKAVRLAREQEENESPLAVEIAERAARLGCRLYRQDTKRYTAAALQALRVYLDLAGKAADAEVVYTAAGILAEQGLTEQSNQMLEWLAESNSEYAVRARMEVFRVQARQAKTPPQRREIEDRWQVWIQSLETSPEAWAALRRQAAIEYVQHLFAVPTRENAERAAQFLQTEPTAGDSTLAYLYVQALALLERFGQAVVVLDTVPVRCENAAFDLYILEAFSERLEEYTCRLGGSAEAAALRRAERLRGCFEPGEDRDRADVLWAELAARLPEPAGEDSPAIDAILSRFESSPSVKTLRCRAFRRMQQGLWAGAAADWKTIRRVHEPPDKTRKQRDWHWWRAKYYELLCYSRLSQNTAEDIAHAVEILEVLYEPAPAVWQAKLQTLTERKK